MQNNLPKGFISVDDAIKLINKDTRTNPLVDVQYLVLKNLYYRAGGNARIPLYKKNKDGEYKFNNKGQLVSNDEVNVHFDKELDVLKFKEAISNHYKEATRKAIDLDKIGLKRYTSSVDDEEGQLKGQPRINGESSIQYGDKING